MKHLRMISLALVISLLVTLIPGSGVIKTAKASGDSNCTTTVYDDLAVYDDATDQVITGEKVTITTTQCAYDGPTTDATENTLNYWLNCGWSHSAYAEALVLGGVGTGFFTFLRRGGGGRTY